MKRINFLLLFCICIQIQVFGQFYPKENYPSPNAASLGEYGNIPVNLYSGQPNISIPLYELKEGDLSLPITLNYNLSAVKPNRRSGWVGLGWNLSSGGCITRNVRGCYDEKKGTNGDAPGFYSNYSYLQNVNNANNLSSHSGNFTGNATPVYELMSDEYNFNFGNYSGRFYLNEYGQWVVVSDDNIQVEFNALSGFRSLSNLRAEIKTSNWGNKSNNNRFFDVFILITPDGVRYTFGGKYATEYSISYYNRNNSDLIPTTWFLTKIESPKGYIISLEYEAGLPVCEIQFSAFSSFTYMNQPSPSSNIFSSDFLNTGSINYMTDNTVGRSKLSGYLIFPVYLKTITASYVKIDLHSNTEMFSEREPLPYGDFMAWADLSSVNTPFSDSPYTPANQFSAFLPSSDIDKIKTEYFGWRILRAISIIPNNENFMKTYYLEYTRNNRKKLTCIAERKGDYNPVESWIYGGWWKDGVEQLGLFLRYSTPEAIGYTSKNYYFEYNTEKKFPRYIFASTDHWGYYNGYTEATEEGERSFSGTYLFDENFYQVRNASSISAVFKAETLKAIRYPTGGKTCFEYTQNRYSKIVPEDLNAGLEQQTGTGGGLCLYEIKNYDTNDNLLQTKRYYYADTIPSANTVTYYNTSGILKAKKKYVINYKFSNGYLSLCSEGGFLMSGTNQTDPDVGYSSVIEETLDANGNSNGFVRYKYTNYDQDIWGESHADRKYLYAYNISGDTYFNPSSSKSMERGKIVSEEYFDSNKKLLRSKQYKYAKINLDSIKSPYQQDLIIYPNLYYYVHAYLAYMTNIYTYRYLLSNEIEKYYDSMGQTMQVKEKSYTYNSRKLINSENMTNSNGDALKTTYKYPSDFTATPYTSMINKNIITPIVEKTTYKGNSWLQKEITDYKQEGNCFVPAFFKTQKAGQANPETRIEYIEYIEHGNPLEVKVDGIPIFYIWSFDGQYLNAEIKNINENAVFRLPSNFQLDKEYFETDILTNYPNAIISSYTYIPSIGMTSSMAPNWVTTYYDYDDLGRLKEIYIMENDVKKVIENYEYNYRH